MKLPFACLLVCLSLGVVHGGPFEPHRPRLGHFKVKPFNLLYPNFAGAIVRTKNQGRQPDDYRNFVPSGDECVNLLRLFRGDDYIVKDLEEIVPLDACLGYLYESKYHEQDRQISKNVDENLDNLLNDEKLQALYEGTQIDKLEEPAKECINYLLLDMISVKDDVRYELYIKQLADFAACQNTIPLELTEQDTYLKPIYELVKKRANECFDYEISAIERAVRDNSDRNPFYVYEQSYRVDFPKPIRKLLSNFQTMSNRKIYLRDVNRMIGRISMKEEQSVAILTSNMGESFNSELKSLKKSKTNGHLTYQGHVDNMCNYFNGNDRDPIIGIARLLSYPKVFGVKANDFIEKLLGEGYEPSALYLSVCACNLLASTEIVYKEPTQSSSDSKFQIRFKADTSEMIHWPDTQ